MTEFGDAMLKNRFVIVGTIVFCTALCGRIAARDDVPRWPSAEELAWENALRENTLDGYLEYLVRFPRGRFAYWACGQLAEVAAETTGIRRFDLPPSCDEVMALRRHREEFVPKLIAALPKLEPETRGRLTRWLIGIDDLWWLHCLDPETREKVREDLLRGCLSLLAHENAERRTEAARALGRIRDPQAFQALVAALDDPDPSVINAAANALGATLDRRAVEPLLRALQGKYPSTVFGALAMIGDPRAVEPLIGMLTDQDPWCRLSAIESLGRLRDPRAVEPLAQLLRDRDDWVRKTAVEALGATGVKEAVAPLAAALEDEDRHVRCQAAEALGEIDHERAIEALVDALKTKDSVFRSLAAHALGKSDNARAVEALIAALTDEDLRSEGLLHSMVDLTPRAMAERALALTTQTEFARYYAGDAIAWIRRYLHLDPVLVALKSKDPWVRGVAAHAIAASHGEKGFRAVQPLLEALKDEEVRASAAFALGEIGAPQAVESLLPLLRKGERKEVRRCAAYALGGIGDARAVGPLIAGLQDDDLRPVAVVALGKLKAIRAVPALTQILKDDDSNLRWHAANALGETGNAGAIEALVAALDDESDRVCASAAEALGKIRDVRAVEPLLAMLKHKDRWIRGEAALALGAIGEKRAVGPLLTTLEEDQEAREVAAYALGQIGDRAAVEPLIRVLKTKGDDGAVAAVRALAEIGDPRALEPLLAAMRDDNLRMYAAHDLKAFAHVGAVGRLVALMLDEDEHSDTRRYAAIALGDMLTPAAVDGLITALKDDNRLVRLYAGESLERYEHPKPDLLVEGLSNWAAQSEYVQVLVCWGWRPKKRDDVVRALVCQRESLPLLALWPHTKRVLLQGLTSGNATTQHWAACCLIWLAQDEVMPDLASALEKSGDRRMAQRYFNSGRKELRAAARKWAKAHNEQLAKEEYPIVLWGEIPEQPAPPGADEPQCRTTKPIGPPVAVKLVSGRAARPVPHNPSALP